MAKLHPNARVARYTLGAIILHWAIALLIVVQIPLGWWMVEFAPRGSALQFDAFQLHKSFGITVLVLSVARVVWRLFNPPPAMPYDLPAYERIGARISHLLFYVLIFAIPLSGWVMISVAPVQIDTVLFFVPWLGWPHLPLGAEGGALYEGSKTVHAWLAYGTGVLLLLHVGAALKHQFVGENVIGRMLPGAMGRIETARRSYGYVATVVATVAVLGGAVWWADEQRAEAARTLAEASGSGDGVAGGEETAAADADGSADAPASGTGARGEATGDAADAPAAGGAATESAAAPADGDPGAAGDGEGAAGEAADADAAAPNASGDGTTTEPASGGGGAAGAARDGDATADAGSNGADAGSNGAGAGSTGDDAGTADEATETGAAGANGDGRGAPADGGGDAPIVVRPESAGPDSPAAAPAQADALPPAETPAQAVLTPWEVDHDRSSLTFSFPFGGNTATGRFARWSADIAFDPDHLDAASIAVVIQTGSASIDSSDVTESQLKGPDGFAVSEYGAAEFSASAIRRTGEGSYVADGTLTIRGVSRPLSLAFDLAIADGIGRASGSASVDRLAYGIGESNDPAGDFLPESVEVSVEVVAEAPAGLADR